MLTLKLAVRIMRKNSMHTIITFICVTLSAILLASVCSLCKTLISTETPGTSSYAITFGMCVLLIAVVAMIATFLIRSVFTVSFSERVNVLGLLSSVGMTDKGKAMLIFTETAIYGVLGSALGVYLGRLLSERYIIMLNEEMQIYYRNLYGQFYGNEVAERILTFESSSALLALSFAISLVVTLFASVKPMIRAGRLSIIDSLKADVRVNISLREGIFERLINEKFGRLGRLAAQNFDNNGPRYRAVSMALSGSTILFITIYSMFMWGLWEDGIYNPFEYPQIKAMMLICFVLTVIALVGAVSSAVTNIKSRKKEFAMLKSLGLNDADLFKMMSFESILILAHTTAYGFVGSMIAVWTEFLIQKMNGEIIAFHFPTVAWLVFVAIDIMFCLFFAVYAVKIIKKVNIAATIK